jgi:hypothetical protein
MKNALIKFFIAIVTLCGTLFLSLAIQYLLSKLNLLPPTVLTISTPILFVVLFNVAKKHIRIGNESN